MARKERGTQSAKGSRIPPNPFRHQRVTSPGRGSGTPRSGGTQTSSRKRLLARNGRTGEFGRRTLLALRVCDPVAFVGWFAVHNEICVDQKHPPELHRRYVLSAKCPSIREG